MGKLEGAIPEAKRAGFEAHKKREKEGYKLAKENKVAEAVVLFRENLEWSKKELGRQHAATVHDKETLAFYLNDLKQYKEASELDGQALATRTKIEGITPPSIELLETQLNLANDFFRLKDVKRAAEVYEKNYELRQKTPGLGKDNPDTLRVGYDLAACWYRLRELKKSKVLNSEVLNARIRNRGAGCTDTQITWSREALALCSLDLGELDAAEALYMENIKELKAKTGKDAKHKDLAANEHALRICWSRQEAKKAKLAPKPPTKIETPQLVPAKEKPAQVPEGTDATQVKQKVVEDRVKELEPTFVPKPASPKDVTPDQKKAPGPKPKASMPPKKSADERYSSFNSHFKQPSFPITWNAPLAHGDSKPLPNRVSHPPTSRAPLVYIEPTDWLDNVGKPRDAQIWRDPTYCTQPLLFSNKKVIWWEKKTLWKFMVWNSGIWQETEGSGESNVVMAKELEPMKNTPVPGTWRRLEDPEESRVATELRLKKWKLKEPWHLVEVSEESEFIEVDDSEESEDSLKVEAFSKTPTRKFMLRKSGIWQKTEGQGESDVAIGKELKAPKQAATPGDWRKLEGPEELKVAMQLGLEKWTANGPWQWVKRLREKPISNDRFTLVDNSDESDVSMNKGLTSSRAGTPSRPIPIPKINTPSDTDHERSFSRSVPDSKRNLFDLSNKIDNGISRRVKSQNGRPERKFEFRHIPSSEVLSQVDGQLDGEQRGLPLGRLPGSMPGSWKINPADLHLSSPPALARNPTLQPPEGSSPAIEDPTNPPGGSRSPSPARSVSDTKRVGQLLFDAEEGKYDDDIVRPVDSWFKLLASETQPLLEPKRRNQSKRIKIAILDTGIDLKHPDFAEDQAMPSSERRIKRPLDFLDPKGNGQDICGHGTHCVGLLRQVAPWADIYVARVATNFKADLDPIIVAKAIRKACNPGVDEDGKKNWNVDILTMSFGFYGGSRAVQTAIQEAINNETLVFAAASNNGTQRDMTFPAWLEGVVCVNSANSNGVPSDFNPEMKGANNFSILGENVKSAWITEGNKKPYKRMSGTSVATPIAAGVAAVVLEYALQNEPNSFIKDLEFLKYYNGMTEVFDAMSREKYGYRNVVPWKILKEKFPRSTVTVLVENALQQFRLP